MPGRGGGRILDGVRAQRREPEVIRRLRDNELPPVYLDFERFLMLPTECLRMPTDAYAAPEILLPCFLDHPLCSSVSAGAGFGPDPGWRACATP